MSDGPTTSTVNDTRVSPNPSEEAAIPHDELADVEEAAIDAPTESQQDAVLKKRDDFLRDLLTAVDLLVYVELAAIYYLDASTPLLLLRSILYLSQLTIPHLTNPTLPSALLLRKPPLVPPNGPLLLLVSVVCLLVHALTPAPTASELTRFYLHGSLLVDFIGQRAVGGWRAKVRLCALDVVVTVLQMIACAVAVEKGKGASSASALEVSTATSEMDLRARGAEVMGERGVLASMAMRWPATGLGTSNAPIELEALNPAGRRVASAGDEGSIAQPRVLDEDETGSSGPGEHHSLLPPQEEVDREDLDGRAEDASAAQLHALETMYAGQATLAEFFLVDMVRNQFWEQRNRRLRGTV